MFEVIQNQEQGFIPEIIRQLFFWARFPRKTKSPALLQSPGWPDRARHLRQGDKIYPILERLLAGFCLQGRGLQGQASLPDASRSDQRQQAAVRIGQQLLDLGEFLIAPDKGCGLGRQVIGGRLDLGVAP